MNRHLKNAGLAALIAGFSLCGTEIMAQKRSIHAKKPTHKTVQKPAQIAVPEAMLVMARQQMVQTGLTMLGNDSIASLVKQDLSQNFERYRNEGLVSRMDTLSDGHEPFVISLNLTKEIIRISNRKLHHPDHTDMVTFQISPQSSKVLTGFERSDRRRFNDSLIIEHTDRYGISTETEDAIVYMGQKVSIGTGKTDRVVASSVTKPDGSTSYHVVLIEPRGTDPDNYRITEFNKHGIVMTDYKSDKTTTPEPVFINTKENYVHVLSAMTQKIGSQGMARIEHFMTPLQQGFTIK